MQTSAISPSGALRRLPRTYPDAPAYPSIDNRKIKNQSIDQSGLFNTVKRAGASIHMGQGGRVHVPPIFGLGGHYHECPPQYF